MKPAQAAAERVIERQADTITVLRRALGQAESGLREGLGAALHHGSAREKDRCEKCYEAAGIINEALDAVLVATDQGPYVTKTGRVLTDADIQALADEAERGYDVSHLVEMRRRDEADRPDG